VSHKVIFILTHGEKTYGPDPGMTPFGHQQVQSLREYLPPMISRVIVGEGRRHFEMIQDLGLDPNLCVFSPMVGRATSNIPENPKLVYLPHGEIISIEQWLPLSIGEVRRFIKPLADGTVVLGGRPLIKTVLKFSCDHNQPAALTASYYKITIKSCEIISIDCHSASGAEKTNREEV